MIQLNCWMYRSYNVLRHSSFLIKARCSASEKTEEDGERHVRWTMIRPVPIPAQRYTGTHRDATVDCRRKYEGSQSDDTAIALVSILYLTGRTLRLSDYVRHAGPEPVRFIPCAVGSITVGNHITLLECPSQLSYVVSLL